jgi:hypothetical protein
MKTQAEDRMAGPQHPLTPLEEALESWEGIRHGLRAELRNVPADRFDFRPAPDTRAVAELVRHVLEVGLMMVGELCRPDTDLHRAPFPDLIARYDGPVRGLAGKDELLAALDSTLDEGRGRFRALGEEGIQQVIARFDGRKGTKLAWMYHGLAHEERHLGQLTVYERLMGLEPALTQRIRAPRAP